MKYRIEGNELIVNGLFSEKRYDFRELTKVSFVDNICIYVVIKAFGQRIQTLLFSITFKYIHKAFSFCIFKIYIIKFSINIPFFN